jgi:chromosome segregation ATPase
MNDTHMSKMYESLKEVVHEISHRSKSDPIPLASVKHNHESRLSDTIDEVQTLIVQKLDGLKAATQQGEEIVKNETQRAEQVIENLRENIAMLESQVREAEETLRRKESAHQTMEETLTAKIDALQDELKKNQETLQSRDNQINNLNSNVDLLITQIKEAELAVQEAKAEAAREVNRIEQLTENFNSKIAALEAHKEKILATRDTEIKDLKSQLQLLTSWVKNMPSFVVDNQNGRAVVIGEQSNRVEDKPADADLRDPLGTSKVAHEIPQTVPPIFFDLMSQELTPIKGANSSMIVRDRVAALGESIEKFPRSRLPALLEVLSEEIVNRNVRIAFRKWFVKHA